MMHKIGKYTARNSGGSSLVDTRIIENMGTNVFKNVLALR